MTNTETEEVTKKKLQGPNIFMFSILSYVSYIFLLVLLIIIVANIHDKILNTEQAERFIISDGNCSTDISFLNKQQ
jgi:hypothetical protein